jgi:hypothetical protein
MLRLRALASEAPCFNIASGAILSRGTLTVPNRPSCRDLGILRRLRRSQRGSSVHLRILKRTMNHIWNSLSRSISFGRPRRALFRHNAALCGNRRGLLLSGTPFEKAVPEPLRKLLSSPMLLRIIGAVTKGNLSRSGTLPCRALPPLCSVFR